MQTYGNRPGWWRLGWRCLLALIACSIAGPLFHRLTPIASDWPPFPVRSLGALVGFTGLLICLAAITGLVLAAGEDRFIDRAHAAAAALRGRLERRRAAAPLRRRLLAVSYHSPSGQSTGSGGSQMRRSGSPSSRIIA